MNLFSKFLFTVFFITIFSGNSFGSILVNFVGHGIIRANHTTTNTAAAPNNPRVYFSLSMQNNTTESGVAIKPINVALSIINTFTTTSAIPPLFVSFPTSTQTIRAAHINGSSIRSVNLDSTTTELTNVPTSTPVFLTAVESGFEGISVPAVETTDTVGIHHVYLSGAIQVTCTKCVPGSINMSGALHYSSNGTRSAGARVWTATPQDPAAGTMERQAVFPITFSTSTY